MVWNLPYYTGELGKLQKKIPVGEYTGNLEMLPKHREILYAQGINSLIVQICDKLDMSAESVLYMK